MEEYSTEELKKLRETFAKAAEGMTLVAGKHIYQRDTIEAAAYSLFETVKNMTPEVVAGIATGALLKLFEDSKMDPFEAYPAAFGFKMVSENGE